MKTLLVRVLGWFVLGFQFVWNYTLIVGVIENACWYDMSELLGAAVSTGVMAIIDYLAIKMITFKRKSNKTK